MCIFLLSRSASDQSTCCACFVFKIDNAVSLNYTKFSRLAHFYSQCIAYPLAIDKISTIVKNNPYPENSKRAQNQKM